MSDMKQPEVTQSESGLFGGLTGLALECALFLVGWWAADYVGWWVIGAVLAVAALAMVLSRPSKGEWWDVAITLVSWTIAFGVLPGSFYLSTRFGWQYTVATVVVATAAGALWYVYSRQNATDEPSDEMGPTATPDLDDAGQSPLDETAI